MTYARREWSEERAAWRAVIFLNLVRNVNVVLDHLNAEMSDLPYNPDDSQDDLHRPRPPRALPRLKFTEQHRLLIKKLGPLTSVQKDLEHRLGTATAEINSTTVTIAAPFEVSPTNRRALQEFSINSSNGWKSALSKFRPMRTQRPENEPGLTRRIQEAEDDIVEIIARCRDEIKSLWDDSIVREMLNRRKVRVEDSPGL